MTTFWEFRQTTTNPTGLEGTVGGEITGNLVQENLNELFAFIKAPPSGTTDPVFQYRKLHVKNVSAISLSGVTLWIDSLEHSDQIFLGIESGNGESITSPTGAGPATVTFSQPADYLSGRDIGLFPAAHSTGVWLRQGLSGIHEPDPYSSFRVNIGGIE